MEKWHRMNKGKKSLLNAMSALIQMAAVSIIGLILTKTIISYFGSEYNGINSTVNQIINALMILEGGFTLATNVALFNPFSQDDHQTVNGIVSATRKRFVTVGLIALIIGLIVTFVYQFMVDGNMPRELISAIMITVLLPSCFNLAFTLTVQGSSSLL